MILINCKLGSTNQSGVFNAIESRILLYVVELVEIILTGYMSLESLCIGRRQGIQDLIDLGSHCSSMVAGSK